MSFEGYYQFICKNGHLSEHDVMMTEPEDFVCYSCCGTTQACTAPLAWWNMVNTTNGSFEPDERRGFEGREVRIDGYIELTPITEVCCDKCHTILEQRYLIPTYGGHHVTP